MVKSVLPVLLCVVAIVVAEEFCTANDNYSVRLQQGVIRGCQSKSRAGKEIYSFKGIRYAKSPTGRLRFAAPEPADSWEGVQDTVTDAPPCIQKNYLLPNPEVDGQEDCLFLNVYTSKLPTMNDNIKDKLAVMVYIHGGGWFSGSGSSILQGPEYLLDEDIVLVTMNYRLGVLGFLSTEDDAATGNWGLKDQTLALKWVQNNIERFGGDPDSVTLFGQSAGAASVHYLILSPSAKGLFQQAISQSGTALNLWATPQNSWQIAQMQGRFVNCPIDNNTELVACLREVDASKLVQSGDKFKFWDVDPLTTFTPSIEKRTPANPEPFIDDYPINLIKQRKFNPVPYIIGVMANEGIIRAAPIISKSKLRNDLNKRWNQLGPELFALPASVPQESVLKLWENMTDFYMKHESFIDENNSENMQSFVNMYSDRSFIYGAYQTALMHAAHSTVFFYKIEYSGLYSFSQLFAGTNETVNHNFSVSHCDDLIYLFRIPILFPDFPEASPDLEFSKVIVKMWTNFAKTGLPYRRLWMPLRVTGRPGYNPRFRHLNIAGPNNMSMSSIFLNNRMEFWNALDITENR